jgi:hypothetical protein
MRTKQYQTLTNERYSYASPSDEGTTHFDNLSDEELNRLALEGWRVVSASWDGPRLKAVLLERTITKGWDQ